MKYKKLISAMLAGAVALSCTGCSGDDEDIWTDETSDGYLADDTQDDDSYANSGSESGGRTYLNGATQLSISGGELGINRRSRSNTTPMGDSGWTILVYLCGSDLESGYSAATLDIIEAISAEYNEDVRIVYQTGGSSEWYDGMISNTSIQRYVTIDEDIELVDEQYDASMGDPATLQDFVSWGIENYPAQHMGLVFWNHGGGSISGVCFDENHDSDSLSLREIDSALNSVYDKMTDKFEFIGFDACLMSTLETANILVPYARYMFASEEVEPGGGWNYTDIMNFLSQNPDADANALGEMQCESYYQHCIDAGDWESSTFSIIDLSKLDALLTSFDKTAKEMYESGDMAGIARAIYNADNFGGNNRSEGYTNMVDMLGLLKAVEPYASNASDTIQKLNAAVIHNINGPQHEGAGGISMYYPLSVEGSQELSIFSDICTSSYYLAFVDEAAYGTTGGDLSSYDNSSIFSDTDDFWNNGYSADSNVGTNYDEFCDVDENSTVGVSDVYFDDEGKYTLQLSDMDAFNYAACSLFMQYEGVNVYLGEDDDVIVDYDQMTIQDDFDGSWPSLDDQPLVTQVVSVGEDKNVYTCPVLLNGEQTNLRIELDWNALEMTVIGAWAGIDPETGAAARETVKLKDGDKITPVYYAFTSDDLEVIYGDEYEVSGETYISYSMLPDCDYSYSMTLYDIYGNAFYAPAVTFTVDEDGEIYYNADDLA